MAYEINWEEKVEEAKKQLLDGVKWKSNASSSFVRVGGQITTTYGNVCHSHLRSKTSKFVINGLQDGTSYGSNPGRILPKETELWFVDYILNRSPYSATFVEKDAAKALETRLTVSSGDHPGNLMGAGLVALRRLWEYVYVAQAAYDLAKAGVNEDLAYYLGHCITVGNVIGPQTPASWNGCTAGHCSMNPAFMGWKELKRFLAHELKHPGPLYSDRGEYDGYDAMYGGDYGTESLTNYIRDSFPIHLYKCGKPVVDSNPFAAAKKTLEQHVGGRAVTAPYHKAIEVMAEWAKTHLMEKINRA